MVIFMNPQDNDQAQTSISYSSALQFIIGGCILYFGAIISFAHLFVVAL